MVNMNVNPQAGQEVRPAYIVQPVTGNYEKEIVTYKKGEDGKPQRVVSTKKYKEGYMVYFPRGHSIFVDKKELLRLGFAESPPLVDMNSGDIVGSLGIPVSLIEPKKSVPDNDAKNGGK